MCALVVSTRRVAPLRYARHALVRCCCCAMLLRIGAGLNKYVVWAIILFGLSLLVLMPLDCDEQMEALAEEQRRAMHLLHAADACTFEYDVHFENAPRPSPAFHARKK